MDQQEFLTYVLGDQPGYIEVAQASAAFSRAAALATPGEVESATWVPYPLAAPIAGDDLVFRPVVVPEPGYDVRRNGITTSVVSAVTSPEYPPMLPPSLKIVCDEQHVESYWHLAEPIPYHAVEELRRRLDPLGQAPVYLWLPEVVSHDVNPPQTVETEPQPTLRTWRVGDLKRLDPPLSAPAISIEDVFWEPLALVDGMPSPETPVGVQTFLAARLPDDLRISRMVGREDNKFERTVIALLDSGLSFAETCWVASHASSNPYRSRRYTWRWETAVHVARITATVRAPGSDVIRQVRNSRKRAGVPTFQRKEDVAQIVAEDMERRGRFVHAVDKTYWYIDRYTGEAIQMTERAERLGIFIASTYGLSQTDPEHRTAVQHLITKTGTLPKTGEVVQLSYYRDDPSPQQRQLFVHFGGREVGLLTADGLSSDPNGNSNLVFDMPSEADPVITTSLRCDAPSSWWNEFMPPTYFRSLDGVDPVHASCLMRVWIQFALFRQAARTRPILAFIGPIGAGKSTTARRLYTLLYGGRKELTTIDTAREYDVLTSNNPFVVFDNLDSCPHWLPTRLEMSITPREQDRRKLFTDNTLYHIKCDAIVGLTSHDTSIFREGVIDRMLVLTFRRLMDDEKLPETEMYLELVNRREEFLSGLLSDALQILRTPRIPFREQGWTTTVRVVDFVDTGHWFANALGILPEFREAITTLKRRQTGMIMEGESSLIDALLAFRDDNRHVGEWLTSSQLWNQLSSVAPDPETFQVMYKTPAVLGSKLAGVYMQIKEITGLEFMEEPRTARKVWRITAE